MAKRLNTENPFAGPWRIAWMEMWDQDVVDAEEEGYFEFKPDGTGSFHFGHVSGQIDYHLSNRDGEPCVDFTWEGNDEMDPALGGGWVVLEEDALQGKLSFHCGDHSDFRAVQAESQVRAILSKCRTAVADWSQAEIGYARSGYTLLAKTWSLLRGFLDSSSRIPGKRRIARQRFGMVCVSHLLSG